MPLRVWLTFWICSQELTLGNQAKAFSVLAWFHRKHVFASGREPKLGGIPPLGSLPYRFVETVFFWNDKISQKAFTYMSEMEPRIKIVGGIANVAAAVNIKLNRKDLAIIMGLFGLKTIHGQEYTDTSKLIKMALDHYADIDETTADNITITYTNTQ